MSEYLTQLLADGDRSRRSMIERIKAVGPAPVESLGAAMGYAQTVLGSSADGLSRLPNLQTHAEQYRHNSGWVYSSIRPIARRVAGQPLRVARIARPGRVYSKSRHFERPSARSRKYDVRQLSMSAAKQTLPLWLKDAITTNLELIEDHPLLDAVQRPNSVMVRWQLLETTVASLELTGKAFWWIRQAEVDEIGPEGDIRPGQLEIWPVPSSWIKPIHTPERLYDHWEMLPAGYGQPINIPREEIVYMYYADPANPLGVISPLSANARAVVADEAIAEAQRRGFSNGLFPGLAITVGRQPDIGGKPGERWQLSKEQRIQLIHAVKQAYRGVLSFNEPIILDSIIQDVKPITTNPRQMDFMESGQYTKGRIVQGFGVNPIIMGEMENANRASSLAADDHLAQWTVNPIIELLSQCLTCWLSPNFAEDGEELVAYLELVQVKDADYDLRAEESLTKTGCMTVNERRTRNGLPPIAGGDVCYMPAGLAPVPLVAEGEVPAVGGESIKGAWRKRHQGAAWPYRRGA